MAFEPWPAPSFNGNNGSLTPSMFGQVRRLYRTSHSLSSQSKTGFLQKGQDASIVYFFPQLHATEAVLHVSTGERSGTLILHPVSLLGRRKHYPRGIMLRLVGPQ